jgi:hypothetical protein
VPSWRVTTNESFDSSLRHSASVFTIRGTFALPVLLPCASKFSMVTSPGGAALPATGSAARAQDDELSARGAPTAPSRNPRLEKPAFMVPSTERE